MKPTTAANHWAHEALPRGRKVAAVLAACALVPALFVLAFYIGVWCRSDRLANLAFFVGQAELLGLVLAPFSAWVADRLLKARSFWTWGLGFLGLHLLLATPLCVTAWRLGWLRIEGP